MAETKNVLLDAAAQVLLRDGGTRLTLASVALEAGVSKGGLLYHFASKQALVDAMVDRLVGEFDAAIAGAGDAPGAATLAYLDNTIGEDPADRDAVGGAAEGGAAPSPGEADSRAAAVIAALAVDPEAIAPLRAAFGRWHERLVNDGIDPAHAVAVRLAVDGWWMARLLGLAPPTGELRIAVRALLVGLTGRT